MAAGSRWVTGGLCICSAFSTYSLCASPLHKPRRTFRISSFFQLFQSFPVWVSRWVFFCLFFFLLPTPSSSPLFFLKRRSLVEAATVAGGWLWWEAEGSERGNISRSCHMVVLWWLLIKGHEGVLWGGKEDEVKLSVSLSPPTLWFVRAGCLHRSNFLQFTLDCTKRFKAPYVVIRHFTKGQLTDWDGKMIWWKSMMVVPRYGRCQCSTVQNEVACRTRLLFEAVDLTPAHYQWCQNLCGSPINTHSSSASRRRNSFCSNWCDVLNSFGN